MTPAPADLSRVLRQHGYEPNITLPDAMRRRIAADLGIAPSELERHIQAQNAPLEPQMETIDKSLPRATRVLKACEAIGKSLFEDFDSAEKHIFAAALGIRTKAAMQYLRDTRAEFAEMNSHSAPEPQETEDRDELAVEDLTPAAEIHTTACTVHPTHTATRCEACVREAEVRVRTETAAQYEAHLNRWAKDYSDAKDALERCVRDRDAAYDREQEAHSTLDDYCGEALNHTVPQRVKELIRTYDECNTAHENLMRENAAMKEQARAGDLTEIIAALGLPEDYGVRGILEHIKLLREQLGDAEAVASMPSVRAVTLEGETQPLPAWYKPGMFQRQSATVFTERERVIATRLLRGQDCGSDFNGMPMDTRAAVLQLAADMAALAAAR